MDFVLYKFLHSNEWYNISCIIFLRVSAKDPVGFYLVGSKKEVRKIRAIITYSREKEIII